MGRPPVTEPGQLNDLRAPSYLYAILTDDRITGQDRQSQEPERAQERERAQSRLAIVAIDQR